VGAKSTAAVREGIAAHSRCANLLMHAGMGLVPRFRPPEEVFAEPILTCHWRRFLNRIAAVSRTVQSALTCFAATLSM